MYEAGEGVWVLSYGWCSPQHPDPTGHRLRCIQNFFKRANPRSGTFFGGVVEFQLEWERQQGLFWDCASAATALPVDRVSDRPPLR